MKESWIRSGRQLICAAKVLLEQLWVNKSEMEIIHQHKTHFPPGDPDNDKYDRSLMEPQISMLLAYALENYLKGLWVHQNSHELNLKKQMTKLPQEFTANSGHDLNALATLTKIDLNEKEAELLRILSEHSTWRGRYAIATNISDNSASWGKAKNLMIISQKYPGTVDWPDELHSILEKINEKFILAN